MGASSSKSSHVEAKENPIIMVLGGPGTGKGTQCARMVKEFGFKHISLGDILRKEVKNGTQIGKDCATIMKEGKLVPLKLTMELIEKAMKQDGNDTFGYLLDGFPRKVNQAKEFKKLVRAPSLVLFLHAPKEVLIHRLMQRGQSSGRADDNIETINKRLITFKKESVPVVNYYEGIHSTTVKKICTVTTPDDVYNQVREVVKQVVFIQTYDRDLGSNRGQFLLLNSRRHPLRNYVKQHHRIVHHKTITRHHRRSHRKRRKGARKLMEECPGHPPGSPVAPAPTGCVLM